MIDSCNKQKKKFSYLCLLAATWNVCANAATTGVVENNRDGTYE